MPAGRGRCARPAELVKKVFLTSSQTRPTALGSRLKGLRLAAAHSLTLARLRAEKYFLRRTCRRRKWLTLYLRLRAQTLRGFFDGLWRAGPVCHALRFSFIRWGALAIGGEARYTV